MQTPKDRFLSTFRGEARSRLVEFAKLLWEKDSEVFVFMARKAACLFDCMKELKLADVRGVALSDRILDMDLTMLKGKTVTLVDDCVFSGTTLYNARTKIMQAGSKCCDTMTLAINRDWVRPELLPGGREEDDLSFATPVFLLDDAQCIRQCYDIVRAMSIAPRPYDVDFPHTVTAKLNTHDFDRLLHCPGWECNDVSSAYQVAHDVRAWSMVPNDVLLDCFAGSHGSDGEAIRTAKVRVYARRLDQGSWSVRLVPIVMLGAVGGDDLGDQSPVWGPKLSTLLVESGAIENHARYRALSFLVALSFLSFYVRWVRDLLGIQVASALRSDLVAMSFGPRFRSLFEDIRAGTQHLQLPVAKPEPEPAILREFGRDTVRVNNVTELVAECMKPFAWLYDKLELPARKLVKTQGLHACNDLRNEGLLRLRKGFSPLRLAGRLKGDSLDIRRSVSLFLDRAVDAGIAVPVVVEDGSCLYRAFRHGEDVVFGVAQERLTILATEAYMAARQKQELWGLELQKFVVLSVQIGLRDVLFEPVGPTETVNVGCRVVSIKGHLHGPVPMVTRTDESGSVGAPFVEGLAYPAESLVESWARRGYVVVTSETKGGNTYRIGEVPGWELGSREEARARRNGRTLGRLVSSGKETDGVLLNHDSDLVLLSACAEPEVLMRCLGGELKIFMVRWRELIDQVRALARKGDYEGAHTLLKSGHDVYTAVNSGAMKYRWFIEGEFAKTVERVASHARTIDPAGGLVDDWCSLWPDIREWNSTNVLHPLWMNVSKMGEWLVSANLAMRVLAYWLAAQGESCRGDGKANLAENFGDCRKWADHVVKYCVHSAQTPIGRVARSILDSLRPSMVKLEEWCRAASQALDNLALKDARVLTDDASLIAASYGKMMGEPRSYPYAVYMDAENGGCGGSGMGVPFNLVKNLLHEDCWLLDNAHNPWRRGLWVLLRGGRTSTEAVQLCADFARRCIQKGIRFRAALVAQLAYDDCARDCPGSSARRYGNFSRRIAQLREHVLATSLDNTIGVAYEVAAGRVDEVGKMASIMSLEMLSSKQVRVGDESSPFKTFRVELARVPTQEPESWSADLGVITVVTEEARAVREILIELVPDVKGPITGKVFDRGRLVTEKGTLTVVHLQLRGQGNMASVDGFRDIYRESSPKLVAVVGIGGSISDKLGLDDVVVANKVIYYDRRKDTADGPIREEEAANVEAAVLDLIQAYQRRYGSQPVHTHDGGEGDPGFKVLIAPIGCGEAKLAYKDSDILSWLVNVNRKCAAVEMESSGVCHAFWDAGTDPAGRPLGVLVVRGISDRVGEQADDGHHASASQHAAQVLAKIMDWYHLLKAPVVAPSFVIGTPNSLGRDTGKR